jgi:hypothetical protein
VATRIIHLINPKTDSVTTRPLYMNRALYSPLAGLLAVAASIPRDRYEVVLTDENIEAVDFDLKADLVGISAMTSYVNRGYEIADQFRTKGVPVVMGGVHPSFMPQEALKHCDAVVIGEVELVIDRLLDDLRHGSMRGLYKSDVLHPMVGMSMPRRARSQRTATPLCARSMGRANCREFNVAWVWGSVPQLEPVSCLSQERSRSARGRGANSDLTRNIRRHRRWRAGTRQCCHSHSPN